MIVLKSEAELQRMREAGRLLADVRKHIERLVEPGITTGELDAAAEEYILSKGAIPAFKGYRGFPGTLCVSVNDEVVHGIPGRRRLQEGDIASIDVGILLNGYCSDTAFTVGVGRVSPKADRLMRVTREALYEGIGFAKAGGRLSDVGSAIQRYVEARGYSVVREYVGHGIGRRIHEDPQVPNFGEPGMGPVLEAGMVLAIEPMVNTGGPEVQVDEDGWTVRTVDSGLSAHFEHTVAITPEGPEVFTETV